MWEESNIFIRLGKSLMTGAELTFDTICTTTRHSFLYFWWIKMWNSFMLHRSVTNSLYNLYYTILATLNISHHEKAVFTCRLLLANCEEQLEKPDLQVVAFKLNCAEWITSNASQNTNLRTYTPFGSDGVCPEITNNFYEHVPLFWWECCLWRIESIWIKCKHLWSYHCYTYYLI